MVIMQALAKQVSGVLRARGTPGCWSIVADEAVAARERWGDLPDVCKGDKCAIPRSFGAPQ